MPMNCQVHAIRLALCAVPLLAAPAAALGHPSYAMYLMDQDMVLVGEVESFDYTIPHSWLQLTVSNEDGTEQAWAIEMEGVPQLFPQGIRQDYVAPGDQISVLVHPMRGGRPAGLWQGSVDAEGRAFGRTDWQEEPFTEE